MKHGTRIYHGPTGYLMVAHESVSGHAAGSLQHECSRGIEHGEKAGIKDDSRRVTVAKFHG
jgi:hypothetical protein